MRIVITGVPGTGKTTIAKRLARMLNLPYISLTEEARKLGATFECDVKELKKALTLPPSFVLEGHLACEFAIPCDVCIVLRCAPQQLEKRLKKRGYSEKKIEENVMAEALDYCTQRARLFYNRVEEVETTHRSEEEVLKIILEILKGKKGEEVDYSAWLLRRVVNERKTAGGSSAFHEQQET